MEYWENEIIAFLPDNLLIEVLAIFERDGVGYAEGNLPNGEWGEVEIPQWKEIKGDFLFSLAIKKFKERKKFLENHLSKEVFDGWEDSLQRESEKELGDLVAPNREDYGF